MHLSVRPVRAYSRLQFFRAISHSLGAYTEAFQFTSDNSDDEDDDDVDSTPSATATVSVTAAAATATLQREMCEVRLIAPHSGVALVSCGHSRFCSSCADVVVGLHVEWLLHLQNTDRSSAFRVPVELAYCYLLFALLCLTKCLNK